ncbi:MAG: hypothetical protein EOO62_07610 [Hymenobacter sp.]|nr:MAG: hypothetical protein EOO62_07610 [Hymenobacter sp.]
MTSSLPGIRVQPAPGNAPSRRSFLRYTGASVALGSLWLASCKKDNEPVARPTITSFTPTSGMAGTTVTVTGTRFTGATAVQLGSVSVSYTVLSDTSLTFVVPNGAPSGLIVVGTPSGPVSTADPFTITTTPVVAPTITSVAPTSALPSATVTLTGTNFTGVTALTVNGIAATPTVVSATTLTFVVPAAAQAGVATIVVTGPGGLATNNTAFTVLPTTVSVGTGDAGVLNYAYALEQLEAAFYTQVRTGTYFTGLASGSAEKLIFDDLYYHEVIHREFFKAAITAAGVPLLKDLTPDFSAINFNDRTSVLSTAKAFEDLGSAAYIGAGQYIQSAAYLFLAGKIASVEARHAAIIRDLVSENTFVGNDVVTLTTAGSSSVATNNGPAGSSLERALAPAEVVAVANTYLAPGSKLDISGIR